MYFYTNEHIYTALKASVKKISACEHGNMFPFDLENNIEFFIFSLNKGGFIPNRRGLTYKINIALGPAAREKVHSAIVNVALRYRLLLITNLDDASGN